MANDLNTLSLIGRLTRDPETKQAGNTTLATFSIANNRTFVSNGEKKEKVNYFECEAWGKLAEIVAQYAKKGRQVAITGRLEQQTWETPEGKTARKVKIQIENFQMLGSQGNNTEYQAGQAPAQAEPSYESQSVEDIF